MPSGDLGQGRSSMVREGELLHLLSDPRGLCDVVCGQARGYHPGRSQRGCMAVLRDDDRALARTDPLTQVANGRAFEDRAQVALGMLRRNTRPRTVA